MREIDDKDMVDQLDSLIGEIKGDIISDEMKTKIVDPYKMRQFMFCYKAAELLASKTGGRVSYKLHYPTKGFGSISIEGKDLSFNNVELFSRAAEFASNTEVYALENGEIRIAFGFTNIARPI